MGDVGSLFAAPGGRAEPANADRNHTFTTHDAREVGDPLGNKLGDSMNSVVESRTLGKSTLPSGRITFSRPSTRGRS